MVTMTLTFPQPAAANLVCRWLRKWAFRASLFLLFLTSTVWLRSQYVGEVFTARFRRAESEIEYESGRLHLLVVRLYHSGFRPANLSYNREVVAGWRASGLRPPENPYASAGPFVLYHGEGGGLPPFGYRYLGVLIPLWAPAAILAIPVVWIGFSQSRYRRRLRRSHGLCVHCGYDLRASSDRCPECGAVAKS